MSDLGRQVKYGVGKGADAAASFWINQLSFDAAPKTQYADNNAAWGVLERTNSSTPLRSWTEGSIEQKFTPDTGGLILLGAFGSVSSADNADTNPIVKDHTFTINQDINGQPLTLIRKDSLSTKKFTNARIGQWELSMALDDYIKYTADFMAKKGVTTTATPAYVDEVEFVAKHFNVRTATLAAGLGSASAISNCETFTVTMNPNLEADNGAGSNEPYGFSSRGYELKFEMTCRYNDTTYEDAFGNGTQLALQVALSNTDVTIGAAAHPGLVLTAPKVFITDWSRSEDLDAPNTQSMTGTIHYSAADLYALRGVLTNTTASY